MVFRASETDSDSVELRRRVCGEGDAGAGAGANPSAKVAGRFRRRLRRFTGGDIM
jgi:hypothetical protein